MPAQTEQTNAISKHQLGQGRKLGIGNYNGDQLKFNSIEKLPTWKLEESKIYNRANSYFIDLAIKKVLLRQQNSSYFVVFWFFLLGFFFEVCFFFKYTQNCDTFKTLSLVCTVELLRKKTPF